MKFSILIPTWNNLDYLKLCIDSIIKNSSNKHEIIIHVNDGSDGTLDWVRNQGFVFSHSTENIGICLSVNHLAGMAHEEWLLYMNDDMYCCPGWDTALIEKIEANNDDRIFLSSLLIEPTDTGNPHVIVENHGKNPHEFDESSLLQNCHSAERNDMPGHASQPTLVSRRWWMMVGGYSLEFSPGMSSDDDLLIKLWIVGIRRYIVVGQSRIYHFACRSTGRIKKNRGSREFVLKWGITQGEFKRNYLDRHSKSAACALVSFDDCLPRPTWRGRLKRAIHGLVSGHPLKDISSWNPNPGKGMS
ncbi:glycosyl transferase family 2 [mine drainage metagenome]|uniref:Glycosyl transferase family 2 n=1 Tax=mine drainage metagenome TaxID=410659 RepID=A0A1J5Q6Q5_9ZZZZ